MGGVFNTVNANLYHYAGNNPVKYTDPDGKFDANIFYQFATDTAYKAQTVALADSPAPGPCDVVAAGMLIVALGAVAVGGGIDLYNYLSTKIESRSDTKVSANTRTKNEELNRLVIQIQDCSKGKSKETLGTSKTQYGDPCIGVTKVQALEALEIATADLACSNNSMVKSPAFQHAKNQLQEDILNSGPIGTGTNRNVHQRKFEYNGIKYRIDLDSYVPKGNAPNLME